MYTKLYTFLNIQLRPFNLKSLNFSLFEFFAMLIRIPTAHINTIRLLPPAEMNGRGIPVRGILPLNISYCIINLDNKKEHFIALFHLFLTFHSSQHYNTYQT